MITTAWQLGGGKLTPARSRFRQVGAHARLRRPLPDQIPPLLGHPRPAPPARTEHRRQQRHPDGERDPWGRPLDETIVLILTTWTYDGSGYTATAGAELALASAARAREHRRDRPRRNQPLP